MRVFNGTISRSWKHVGGGRILAFDPTPGAGGVTERALLYESIDGRMLLLETPPGVDPTDPEVGGWWWDAFLETRTEDDALNRLDGAARPFATWNSNTDN